MKTMATSGENTEYWVKVGHRHVGILEFKMPKTTVPSDDEVLEELKKQVENLKQKDGKKDEKRVRSRMLRPMLEVGSVLFFPAGWADLWSG